MEANLLIRLKDNNNEGKVEIARCEQISLFLISHSVFKRLLLQTSENQGLFGKGLSIVLQTCKNQGLFGKELSIVLQTCKNQGLFGKDLSIVLQTCKNQGLFGKELSIVLQTCKNQGLFGKGLIRRKKKNHSLKLKEFADDNFICSKNGGKFIDMIKK